MTADTGGVQGQTPLQWGTTTNNEDATRTTKTATFSSGGREYTVTVSYSRQAVMDKYEVGEDRVDQTMEEVISRIGQEQLSKLSGHSISTSLSDPSAKARFKSLSETDYHEMPDTIPADATGDLLRTINSVRSIFAQTLGEIRGGGTIDLEVEELDDPESVELGKREISFVEQKGGFKLKKEEPRLAQLRYILPDAHPLHKDHDDKLELFAIANEAAEYDQKDYDAIKQMLKGDDPGLTKEQQHEALSLLKDQPAADNVRVQLGLQKDTDIIADSSQGVWQIEGQLEGVGSSACATICAHAIYELVTNPSHKIDSPDQLYNIMDSGIKIHIEGAEPNTIPGPKNFYDEVFPGLCKVLMGKGLDYNVEQVNSDTMTDFDENQFVVVTAIPKQFREEAGEGKQTAKRDGETVLLFRQNEKFCVFDSHGTSFEGVPRGASVRQFDTDGDLKAYMDEKFGDKYNIQADLVKKSGV